MANDVYANGREISCKKADGKSICAFPDVVFTPPQTPATPPGVPIPYPNTGMAKDTTKGSKKVKISGKEVILKNKSHFKKSYGDEAGCAPKKGILTSKNRGKIYFNAWSMDVKVEGKNVVRHFDLTTHNHSSLPGNTAPWLYLDSLAISLNRDDKCTDVKKQINDNCSSESEFLATGPPPNGSCSAQCCEAKKCAMAPYKAGGQSNMHCCDGKTKHHAVPDHCFKDPGKGDYYEGIKDLNYDKGLAICVDGTDKSDNDSVTDELKTHGKIHQDFDRIEDWYKENRNQEWTFEEANEVASDVVGFHTGCDPECLKQQNDVFYRDKGVHGKTTLRANSQARSNDAAVDRSNMGNSKIIWSLPGK
ncbi:MAG: DUF4150 domain-containing protein [Candidatus Thiodiazotropha sp.]